MRPARYVIRNDVRCVRVTPRRRRPFTPPPPTIFGMLRARADAPRVARAAIRWRHAGCAGTRYALCHENMLQRACRRYDARRRAIRRCRLEARAPRVRAPRAPAARKEGSRCGVEGEEEGGRWQGRDGAAMIALRDAQHAPRCHDNGARVCRCARCDMRKMSVTLYACFVAFAALMICCRHDTRARLRYYGCRNHTRSADAAIYVKILMLRRCGRVGRWCVGGVGKSVKIPLPRHRPSAAFCPPYVAAYASRPWRYERSECSALWRRARWGEAVRRQAGYRAEAGAAGIWQARGIGATARRAQEDIAESANEEDKALLRKMRGDARRRERR